MSTDTRPAFPWLWLVPSLVLLIVMGMWATSVYPNLPEMVPRHVGASGVDAWSRKSVGSVFIPVFLYLATTMVFVGTAFGIARTTPDSELPRDHHPGVVNRPATSASASRCAKAVLMLNTSLGVALLPVCAVQWRTTQTPEVSQWLLPVFVILTIVGMVPLLVAGQRDRAEKRERAR